MVGTYIRAGSKLTPLSVQARTMRAESLVASALSTVIGLDIVALSAKRVVVVHGLASTGRVPRKYFRHLTKSSENSIVLGS